MDMEYDVIEFSVNDTVQVEEDIDKILDFLNDFPSKLKDEVLASLNKENEISDKALFFVSQSLNNPVETYYLILCKVVTLDEKGLILLYSTNMDLISLYMSRISTLSYDKVKESFKTKDDK
jgi:hypothetical protein